MKNYCYLIILIILFLGLSSCTDVRIKEISLDESVIENPERDLRKIEFTKQNVLRLNGNWYYWPRRFLNEKEIRQQLSYKNNRVGTISVPSMWSDVKLFESDKDIIHRGTIALKLKLPPGSEPWSVRLPNANAACQLFVNSELVSEIGTVSSNRSWYKPSNNIAYSSFKTNNNDVLLIIHVSNYSLPYTGLWDAPTLGLNSAIMQQHNGSVIYTSLISGALIFMGLYQLIIYILRKQEKGSELFCLICIFMAVRNLMMGERILLPLFSLSEASFHFAFAVEHLSAHMCLPLFFLFFKKLFPSEMKTLPLVLVLSVSFVWAVLVIFTPPLFYHRFLSLFEYIIAIAALYLIYVIVAACIKKREGASIIIIGFFILLLCVLNDILLSNMIIESVYITSFGFFVFCFSQSFFLSSRFAKSFRQIELYSKNLTVLNKSLERFVPAQLLSFLNKQSITEVELGDYTKQTMNVLFLDIRNFTSMSESMGSQETFGILNNFLNKLGPLVRKHNGFIDKYLGDGFMALFPGSSDDAILAAIDMRNELLLFNKNNLHPISFGIGINRGELMLGTIGEKERMDGTVISDAVNTASRLEQLTKLHQIDILISKSVIDNMESKEKYFIKKIGEEKVKGKTNTITVFSIYKRESLLKKANSIKSKNT